MDKKFVEKQFVRSLVTYNASAKAQQEIVCHFFELIKQHLPRQYSTILEFGVGTGLLTQKLTSYLDYKQFVINDFSRVLDYFSKNIKIEGKPHFTYLPGDIEQLDLSQTYDLIISTSTEQWILDKPMFYQKVFRALNSGGYFAFTSFGNDNMKELYKATGNRLDYFSVNKTISFMDKRMDVILAQEDRVEVCFESVQALMRHIKETGVNGLKNNKDWTKKSVLELFNRIEKTTFVSQNKYCLTYHPTYYILQKQ